MSLSNGAVRRMADLFVQYDELFTTVVTVAVLSFCFVCEL